MSYNEGWSDLYFGEAGTRSTATGADVPGRGLNTQGIINQQQWESRLNNHIRTNPPPAQRFRPYQRPSNNIELDRLDRNPGLRQRPTATQQASHHAVEETAIDMGEDTAIDSGLSSGATETTGLLAGGAAAVEGASTASIVTAGAAGGAIVGGILGGVLTKGRGAVLPGHNFIGPGNPLDHAPPVDEDDAIAKEHDEAYAKAKRPADVHKADEEAIKKFKKDWEDNGNLHSKIGQVGLQIKSGVEKHITGVLYPRLSGTYT